MKSKVFYYPFMALFVLLIVPSCNKSHSKTEIESSMKKYDHLIQKMDIDSISLMFTPNGDLGDVAHGRSWIKRYLSGFTNVKVLEQNSASNSIQINADSATQTGTYTQVTVISPGDTARLKGDYIARWIWNKNTGWLLQSITTKPRN